RRRGPAGRLEREGHHPRHHREDRHGRRSGLRARIPRPGDPSAVHGGTHDDLQYVDRSRGARRNGRPDETTVEYVKGRPHAPEGEDWDAAVEYWKTLYTDEDAEFDAEVVLEAADIEPFVTWGTNPGQGLPLSASVPSPDNFPDE